MRRPRNDPSCSPAREPPPPAPTPPWLASHGLPGTAPIEAGIGGWLHGGGPASVYRLVRDVCVQILWLGVVPAPFFFLTAEIPRLFNFTDKYSFQKDLEAIHGVSNFYFAKVRTLLKNNWYLLSPITSCKKGRFNTKDKISE